MKPSDKKILTILSTTRYSPSSNSVPTQCLQETGETQWSVNSISEDGLTHPQIQNQP